MKKKLIGSLLLGMSLVACQDKFDNIEDINKNSNEVSPENQVTLFEFDADIESPDESRANTIGDITLVKSGLSAQNGNSTTTPEHRPSIKFRNPQERKANGTLVGPDNVGTPAIMAFCGVDPSGNKSFYRVPVRISVIELLRGNTAKVRAWVPGGSPSQQLFTLGVGTPILNDKKNETWYAMLICGGEDKPGVTDALHFELKNREQAKSADLTSKMAALTAENAGGASSIGDGVFVYRQNGSYGTQNMDFPMATEWKKLNVTKTVSGTGANKRTVYTAKELKFTFKPQGTFITYHLGVNVNYGIDMRRIGIVSNAVDFQGKYKLDDASLKAAFESKNTAGWGIPAWEGYEPDAKELQGIQMYTVNEGQDPGLFGTKTSYYPWDMPTIQDAFVKTTNTNLAQLSEMTETVNEASMAQSFPWINNGKVDNAPVANKWRAMTVSGMGIWTRSPGSGLREPVGTPLDYVTYTQWAMPKPQQPQKRFTYLWVQANGSFRVDDLYAGSMTKAGPLQVQTSQQRLGFIQQTGPRVQPMVVVHQTNRDFSNQVGKTPHLNAVLTSDLLISELKVYSGGAIVELHNTTQRSIDLKNYALVRLVDNGSKMQFRTSRGQKTDDLDQAELYYLSSVAKNDNLYFGDNKLDYNKQASDDVLEDGYTNHYIKQVDVGTTKPVLGGQTVLFGAASSLARLSAAEKNNITEAWGRYLYQTNSPVLVLQKGDGIALVRLYNGGATKKIIDTTAPIGSSNYGFAGTYQSYKNELNRWKNYPEYSQQRMDGVSFPFLPPYRTKRETGNWSDDWTVSPASDLGDRNNHYYEQRTTAPTPYVTTVGGSYFSTVATPLKSGNETNYRKARPEHR